MSMSEAFHEFDAPGSERSELLLGVAAAVKPPQHHAIDVGIVGNSLDFGVSINGGTPKWIVYFMRENLSEMDDSGVPPF